MKTYVEITCKASLMKMFVLFIKKHLDSHLLWHVQSEHCRNTPAVPFCPLRPSMSQPKEHFCACLPAFKLVL